MDKITNETGFMNRFPEMLGLPENIEGISVMREGSVAIIRVEYYPNLDLDANDELTKAFKEYEWKPIEE